jgi:glycosyltransferase involved in cell wall biosynthesis
MIKVLYLFTSYRGAVLERARKGEDHGNGFWGMLSLPRFGIEAEHVELEQYLPFGVAKFVRRFIGVYWIHLPLYWKFFSYDIVFTSTAFGTQLVHTLLHVRRPKWVMHDFSIVGLIGEGKSIKQKIFRYITSRCAGIVTLSKEETKRIEKLFPHLTGHVEFIPFGVNLDFFVPQPGLEHRHILAPGFDPDRDWGTLIEASKGLGVSLLAATRPKRLEKLGPLPDFVKVVQFSPRELVDAYARAAVVVLPLDTSGGVNDAMGSSTLFEAMAMGKAIVATNTHTTASYITNGENGLLVEEGNVEAMKEALKRVLEDEELRKRLGKNARIYATEHLDMRACASRLAEFFKKISQGTK